MIDPATGLVRIRPAYIDSRWGWLHYRLAGPAAPSGKPPLLLLHQTPKSGWEYEPLLRHLGRDRVVIAPDTPGYGASEPPPEPVRIEDYAEVAAQLMQDLAAEGCVPAGVFDVMGMHTGSVTATQLAVAYPDRVRRVVLLGLAAYDDAERSAKLAALDHYPKIKADLSHIEAMWSVLQHLFDPRTDAAYRHKSLAENLRAGARMPWGYSAVYRYDFRRALAAITQPVLILKPDDDLADITGQTLDLIPDHRVAHLPGAKHGLLELDTDLIEGLIRDFLDAETV
jgi:pimeloyl-ACP methyl ester carboxylesterase